jgi:hypothetical protein
MSVARITVNGQDFANVAAGGVATANITPGNSLDKAVLNLGGTTMTKALIETLKLMWNGRPIWELSGTQLDKINAYRGKSADAAFLTLPFADETGLTEIDRAIGAFDTSLGTQTLQISAKIGAGASAPTLSHQLYQSPPQRNKAGVPAEFAGLVTKFLRYNWDKSVGGTLSVPLPFGEKQGAVIKRLHIEHGGYVTGVTVKESSNIIHESTKAKNEFSQKEWGRVPQANWYTVDFVEDGNMMKAWDTRNVRSLELIPTLSQADSGYVIVEYLDRIDNL